LREFLISQNRENIGDQIRKKRREINAKVVEQSEALLAD
jgi:hypothetical protein